MKLSGASAKRFCNVPDPEVRAVLLYGVDRGLVAQAGRTLIGRWMGGEIDPMSLTRLAEEGLSDTLEEALPARPLLSDRAPVVQVRLQNERAAAVIVRALEAHLAGQLDIGGYWLVEAGGLPEKSRMLKLFSDAPEARALRLDGDRPDTVRVMIEKAFEDCDEASISRDAVMICADALAGNRALAVNEIGKMRLFAQGLGRPLSATDVAELLQEGRDRDAGALVDASLAGDAAAADRAARRFFSGGGQPVSALRTLSFRLVRLARAHAGERWLSPPVTPDARPAFARARQYWTPARLTAAFAAVRDAELQCKISGPEAMAVCASLLGDFAARRISGSRENHSQGRSGREGPAT